MYLFSNMLFSLLKIGICFLLEIKTRFPMMNIKIADPNRNSTSLLWAIPGFSQIR